MVVSAIEDMRAVVKPSGVACAGSTGTGHQIGHQAENQANAKGPSNRLVAGAFRVGLLGLEPRTLGL